MRKLHILVNEVLKKTFKKNYKKEKVNKIKDGVYMTKKKPT